MNLIKLTCPDGSPYYINPSFVMFFREMSERDKSGNQGEGELKEGTTIFLKDLGVADALIVKEVPTTVAELVRLS